MAAASMRALGGRQNAAASRHSATRSRVPIVVRCAAAAAVDQTAPLVERLKKAAKQPGSMSPSEICSAMIQLEKAKVKPTDAWPTDLASPSARWRLVYTAGSKDVIKATKGEKGSATSFPLTACQKFDAKERTFENGVFLGLGYLTFKGGYLMRGKQLNFDVEKMTIGLGPWVLPINLKKPSLHVAERPQEELRKLPFFLYAYIDHDMIVARGRSGGLALWVRADTEWMARSGVLAVYK